MDLPNTTEGGWPVDNLLSHIGFGFYSWGGTVPDRVTGVLLHFFYVCRMLKHASVLIRFFLFWMVFFAIDRLIFVLNFWNKLADAGYGDIFLVFLKGLRIDASTSMYLSAFPLIVYFVVWLIKPLRLPRRVPVIYTGLFITVISLISIINFNVYREWGTKINYRILDYAISSPQEAMASSASSPFLLSFTIFFIQLALGFWLSRRIIDYRMPGVPVPLWQKIPAILLLVGASALIFRGGWQLSPINQSMAYFSDRPAVNHAAVNTEWNLIHDVLNNRSVQKNPYLYLPEKEAQSLVRDLYAAPDSSAGSVLTTTRPNIVMVILESFTGQVVESLDGEKGVAPQLEKLIGEGIFFDQVYASGDRTDRGLVAILSGFPSQAIRSILKQNDKQEKLPAISSALSAAGYHNSFFYGGESEFFNLKSYILSHDYQDLVDKKSFRSQDMNSKWGAYDHVVYQRLLQDQQKVREPFFSTLLTLTNHEPFELPVKHRFGDDTVENQFRSTAFYTDSALYAFIGEARKQPWYKNTLFVIVADHGHRLPSNKFESYHPGRNRIPLLFFGEVIKPEYRGRKISKTGSQTDLATTLLNQLGLPADDFVWGKDLLNPASKDFAFYDWDNGFGVITPDQSLSFDNVGRKVIYRQPENHPREKELLRTGKAYMQEVFTRYISY